VTRTVILGAGFGGIAVATELRAALGDEHEIVLVDRRERFAMGLRKVWELVDLGTIAEGSRSREVLAERGIRFLQGEIGFVDPEARTATIEGETLESDHLVVALGAEQRPDLVPGLADHGHDAWDPAGVPGLRRALGDFDGGRIAIVIAGAPYPCPPAPYELAMLLDESLRDRGLRERTQLAVATVQPLLMPNAGQKGSAWIGEELSAREISWETGLKVERVERGRVVHADGELEFDLLVGIPPHRVPAVVAASALAGEGGWVRVDKRTLETAHEGVFAIGDVTQIKLANDLPLPKAGVIAELEGRRVAAAIAARVNGTAEPPAFDGRGYCFVETGRSQASLVEGEFFAEPEPRVELQPASAEAAEQKRRFEAERLEAWFGS
jgi:sulfide:quinone oxidoreductase